jgi:hypothetical protein
MDITTILPSTNKAGQDLVSILEKDGKQKEFKKLVSLITSYANINQYLLHQKVTTQYVYDVIYRDYVGKIKKNFEQKYASYMLNILHKKYVDYLIELREMIALYETDHSDSLVDCIESYEEEYNDENDNCN